jgi:hypothetical protein
LKREVVIVVRSEIESNLVHGKRRSAAADQHALIDARGEVIIAAGILVSSDV